MGEIKFVDGSTREKLSDKHFAGLHMPTAKKYLKWLYNYFYGVYSEDAINYKFFHSFTHLIYDWNRKSSEAEFYKRTNGYIFNLMYWHSMLDKKDEMNALATHFEDAKTVLDFGCGMGFDADVLARVGKKVTATDLYGQTFVAAMQFTELLGGLVKFKNISEALKDTYDVVLAMDVIGHVKNVADILDIIVAHSNKYIVVGLDLCDFEAQPMHHKENVEWQQKTEPYLVSKGFSRVALCGNVLIMRRI